MAFQCFDHTKHIHITQIIPKCGKMYSGVAEIGFSLCV